MGDTKQYLIPLKKGANFNTETLRSRAAEEKHQNFAPLRCSLWFFQ